MKKNNINNEKEKIFKLGKLEIKTNLSDLISTIVLLIVMILYFSSPNIYKITTASYGKGTEEENRSVKSALGEDDTEKRFMIYFQWYNVIHELGHGILRYNSNLKISPAEEEQLVNDFAVAYWLYYGEQEKIDILNDTVEYASKNIKSDVKAGMNYMEFAKTNWNKPSFNTFNNYGWFQFNSVKESLKNKKTLTEVLNEMEIKNIKLEDAKVIEYGEINEEKSTKIINDAVNNFRKWGLEFPDTYQFFSDNPNNNYSGNRKNFLGIYNVINKYL